ncbi:MAG TPA: universal stress protein [Pyrinomonadaceae bacterium]|nr:universal stress protein [Pyrinomonadaceae bacterium]
MKNSLTARNGAHDLRITNILVPIDFSARSIATIATARYLAQHLGARVHLGYAQEFTYPAALMAPGAPVLVAPMTDFEKWRKAAEARLRALAKKHGLTGTCRAEIGGAAFDTLCWIADQVDADLLVTSTHGRTGLTRAFLGSTAERLVQHSSCPVYVAREPAKAHSLRLFNTILVPVDFSDCSLAGLDYAINFAKGFAARLLVVHVVDLAPLLADTFFPYDRAALAASVLEAAHSGMTRFIRKATFGGVPFKTLITMDAPVAGICDVARSENVDLIITATHGRAGLKHVLIGSTAEITVRHAHCPVLVVPSHPRVRTGSIRKQEAPRKRPVRSVKISAKGLARKYRQPALSHAPEHRLTNKFRESHRA